MPARYRELWLCRLRFSPQQCSPAYVALEVQTYGGPFGMMGPRRHGAAIGGRSHGSQGCNRAGLGDVPGRQRSACRSMDRPVRAMAAWRLGRIAHAPLSAGYRFPVRIRERVRDQHPGRRETLGGLRRSVPGRRNGQPRTSVRREGRDLSDHVHRAHRPQPSHRCAAQYAAARSGGVGARPDRPSHPILVRPTLPERFYQLESRPDAGGWRFRGVWLRLPEPHVLRR